MANDKHTLLLWLVGPMQSWGTQSRFVHRDAGREPSKSGVIGLVCAALGRPRHEPVDDLAALKMGVRVDREGVMSRDYHTARDCVRADGTPNKDAVISERFYLADAAFLVGLEGDPRLHMLMTQARAALQNPRWQIYLGRKSFLPTEPLVFENSLRTLSLREALRTVALKPPTRGRQRDRVRLVLEVDYGAAGAEIRQDQPLGAAFRDRRFGLRYVDVEMPTAADLAVQEATR